MPKNMIAQQLRLTAEYIDEKDLDLSDKNTKLVLTEWINILSKASVAFLSDDSDEIEVCKEDMQASMSVITSMADITGNKLAMELAHGKLEDWIDEIQNFKLDEACADFCDIAHVIKYSWEGILAV